jgi:hypothetical protein
LGGASYWQPHPPELVVAVSQQPSFADGSQQEAGAVVEQQLALRSVVVVVTAAYLARTTSCSSV